ncbi:MAG: serine/threonine protein kinase [Eubacterium sp.]|nr:serine/threonine protein kinase [Eubacterium sp.]
MLENGTVIDGKYEILSKVGQGGMSVVYLALNRKAMKQWAIKEVRRDGVKDFEVVKQSLVAETDMLKKLSHPNLPDIVDIIENDDSFFIVMDYIEGKPLSKRIEESGPQPEEYVIEWARQLCDVLDYLHTQTPPIVYRDMKPSNVMLKPDGSVCLIDFGTAREYKGTNIQDTTCLGTIGYAAPEQFGGQGETDARTDIYCLGATLYHLVTGHSPAEPPYEMHPIRYWDERLSPGLEAIILKCIQKDPNDRYQSCAELKYALENIEENTATYWKEQKKKLNLFLTSVIATLLCLVVGITGSILSTSDTKNRFENNANAAMKEAGDDAVKDFDAAFDTGYMGAKPEEVADYFVAYCQALVDNNEPKQLTGDEIKILESRLGIGDDTSKKSVKYDSLVKKSDAAYCRMNYEIGVNIYVYSDNENAALGWFNRAIGLGEEGDKGFDASDFEDNVTRTDFELAETFVAMIKAWSQIQDADQKSLVGGASDYEEIFQTISDAITKVRDLAGDFTELKLRVYYTLSSFLSVADNFKAYQKNTNGQIAPARDLWTSIYNEVQSMSGLSQSEQEWKDKIEGNATMVENNFTEYTK